MKEKIKILGTVGLYHAVNDGSIAAVPLLFPIFRELFDLSYTEIGAITGLGLLVHIIAQLMIGRTSDGKNSRTLLSLGILLISISLLLLTNIRGFYTLLLLIILLRFSISFFHPIGVGLVSRTFKNHRLDWAMGIQSGSANIGSFIAISTTLYIAEITSWDYPLYIWSIACALAVIIGINLTSKVKEEYIIVKKVKQKQKIKEIIEDSKIFLKKIKLLIPAIAISGASWGVITTYLPLFLDEKTALSLSFVGMIVAVWIGIGVIASFLYGSMSSIFGRKNLIYFSYITIGITSVILSTLTNAILITMILVILGIAVFISYPAIFSFISEITHESSEGKSFGTVFTLQLTGGTILVFLGGYLSDIFGIWIPFVILGIISLAYSIVLIICRKQEMITC